jgi:predicted nuclease with TOPRIM domain
MSNVLSLRCARERAWQPRAGSNGHGFKELGQSAWKSKITERDGRTASNQRLLERLEAENAQLRESVVELALQIQALRDRARTLTA